MTCTARHCDSNGSAQVDRLAVHLHSPVAVGRALPDVEEASGGSLRLATLSAGASAVDDHGFALEQAHQVWRLLALSHSHLGL